MAFVLGANYNVVIGNSNTISGTGSHRNVILAGTYVSLVGTKNFIANAEAVTFTSGDGAVIAGGSHTFANTNCNGLVVLGGKYNAVTGQSYNGVMIGGQYNSLRGHQCSIVGGDHNQIYASALHCGIFSGQYGEVGASSSRGVVLGGHYGKLSASSSQCGVLGGFRNTAGGTNSVVVGGTYNTSSGTNSVAMGNRTKTTRAGEFGHNSVSFFDATGNTESADRGYHRVSGNIKTTSATVTTILTLTLSSSTAYLLTIRVVGNQSGGSNRASYVRRATAYRATAGVATLQGSVETLGTDVESNAAWDVTVDVTGNDLRVRATGVAATNINWTAVVEWTAVGEVTN